MKYLMIILFTVLILSSLNAQDKPAPKISGYMFGDYFYNVARDTGIASLSNVATGGKKDLNGFQFRRIYLSFDGDISSSLTSRFRIEGTTGAPFIKDAYLKWKKVFSGADLIFGLQPMPAVELSETIWKYRSLEKSILDLQAIVSSRDLGVSLRGKLAEDGSADYWVAYGNSSGIGAETDKYKRIYASVSVKPVQQITIGLYGDYKINPNVNDPASTATPKATFSNNSLLGAFLFGYNEANIFDVGFIGFYQTQANGFITLTPAISVKDKNGIGLSFFATYFIITENVNLIGRYDYYDPNFDSNSKGDSRNYMLAGADFKVDKNFSIMPNVQFETYEDIPTASGNRSVDSSITVRITLFYTFL